MTDGRHVVRLQPDMPSKPQVFLSYAAEDQDVAVRIQQHLEVQGLTCWMAPLSIAPGSDFPVEIVKAIEDAKVLVLLLSRCSNASRYVQQEVRVAFDKGTRIVPIQIEPVELSDELELYISSVHRLESSPAAPAADLDRLVSTVKTALEEITLSRTARLIRFVRRGRRALLAAGLLLALVVSYPAIVSRFRRRTNPIDGQQYAWVPPGEFVLGCSPGDSECGEDEKPAGRRKITAGFWLATSEATVKQWNAYARKLGLKPLDGDGELPAIGITRDQAIVYCRAVGGRLPTETEWEYAARAGSEAPRYGRLPEIAWYNGNSGQQLHAGGGKQPNAFGLYDMLGNVWEWTSDRYYDHYDAEGEEEPAHETDAVPDIPPNGYGVVRGGSSISDASALRASNRFGVPPDSLADVSDPLIGLRCARDRF